MDNLTGKRRGFKSPYKIAYEADWELKNTGFNYEEELMKTSTPYPQTVEEIIFQKRVDALKNNLDEILVSPFNHNTWSEI